MEVFALVASVITLVYIAAVIFIIKKRKNSIIDAMPVAEKEKVVAKKKICISCGNIIIPEFDGTHYVCPICSAIVDE